MVIDMSTGFHFRREGKGILLAWNDPKETPGFKTEFDPGFVEKILTHAASRVPVLAEAEVNPRRAWAGLYEMTPDHHAIIGPAPNVEGLFRERLQRSRRDALAGVRPHHRRPDSPRPLRS
jgi:sarcosine oxidase subunit beta